MKRRVLFKSGMLALLASLVNKFSLGKTQFNNTEATELQQRKYTEGVNLSIIGFGGIVVVGMDQRQANDIVAESFDKGVNYFDVAPSYWDGEAEEKLGKALQPYRKDIFLACKTMERDAKGSEKELNKSLNRIGVDHFDLYQLHAVTGLDEVERIFAPQGAMETFVKAQKEGKVRFIGFSAHSEEAALALLERFEFNSLLFPINFVCFAQGKFGPRVLEKAKEKGVSRLAIKALAHTPLAEGSENPYPKCWYKPVDDKALAEMALRFTLSQDITAAIPPGEERLYRMALELAMRYKPMGEKDMSALLAKSAGKKALFPLH